MRRPLSCLAVLITIVLVYGTVTPSIATAQYNPGADFDLAWTLDPRDHPDLFDRGPTFGARSVLTGMDFDNDGNKEILFVTDETISQPAVDPGFLDVYLYEAAGDDTYEYVWHWTEPEASNSLAALTYGDMDGDGLQEIFFGIPTINDAMDLFIFEQNPDGTFPDQPTVEYDYDRDASLDFRPAGFHLEDIDGDGDVELATISRTGSLRELVVISLTGELDAFATFDIEFEVGESVLGGGALYDVDVADFDGDGMNEIWVNTWDNFSWAVFEATGPDTYTLSTEINGAYPDVDPGSFNSHKLLFHDIEGDGSLELLAPMTNGKLYYLDDTDDVSSVTGESFSVVGTFDPTARTRGADLGDVDGDGRFDIVVGTGSSETIERIEYNGSGDPADSSSYTWTTILESVGGTEDRYYPLRIADDLDGDGFNEVVITNLQASNEGQAMIIILESTVAPSDFITANDATLAWTLDPRDYPDLFDHKAQFDTTGFGTNTVAAGMDFDGDGNKEFIFTTDETVSPDGPDPGHLDVFLYEATGDDTYEHVWHWTHPDPTNSFPPLIWGDMDQDGRYEIFMGVPTINDSEKLFVFEQEEDGTFPDEPTTTYDYERDPSLDFRPSGFALDDVDGDGEIELVTISRTSGLREMVVTSLTGGLDAFASFTIEFEAGESVLGGGGLYDVDIEDFDGDGMKEIWVNTWDNFSWAVFEATGADTYTLSTEINQAYPGNDPGSYNRHELLFWDVEGDGDLELYAPMTDGRLYFLDDVDDVSTITGESFVEVGIFDPAPHESRGGDIGDFDGDGMLDIMVGHGRGELVSRIEYDGSGDPADSLSYSWTTLLDTRGGATEYIYPLTMADDLDGDGKNEVIITNRYADSEGQPIIFVVESTESGTVAIGRPDELPEAFVLRQNYPNPFNPETTISFELRESATVSVRVFDTMGRLVATLVNDQAFAPGSYQVMWNARSDAGAPVASGVYFYTLESRDFSSTRKMVLMK